LCHEIRDFGIEARVLCRFALEICLRLLWSIGNQDYQNLHHLTDKILPAPQSVMENALPVSSD